MLLGHHPDNVFGGPAEQPDPTPSGHDDHTKVMQVRNNYDKGTAGVFNGSVGVVTALSLEDAELRVLLDEDEEVGYGFDELDELTHAYAVASTAPKAASTRVWSFP